MTADDDARRGFAALAANGSIPPTLPGALRRARQADERERQRLRDHRCRCTRIAPQGRCGRAVRTPRLRERGFPMRTSLLLALVVAVASAPVASQEATALLERIEEADIDAPRASLTEWHERRVCLNASDYVFALLAHPRLLPEHLPGELGWAAAASVRTPEWTAEHGRDGEVVRLSALNLGDPVTDPPWASKAFVVDEPECFDVQVLGGRARIYRLNVTVEW